MSSQRRSSLLVRALLLLGPLLAGACAAPAPADAPAGASAPGGSPGTGRASAPGGANGHSSAAPAGIAEAADPVALAPAPAVLRRVAVLGASCSNGFGIKAEVGEAVRLAGVVDGAIRGAHERPLDASNSFLFLEPEAYADELVERALEYRPSLLVAADFLFWFGYGVMPEEARPLLLERGLALLDRFDCPLLVGDLPYMPQAVGGMLLASQLPEEATIEALNARIRAWCDERPRATLVPVADFAERLTRGLEVDLEGAVVGGPGGAEVLQPDRLHPTLLGASGLAVLALDRLAHSGGDVTHEALVLDPARLAARALALETARSAGADQASSPR